MERNVTLISYCGLYCEVCPSFVKGKCRGCRGDAPDCAVGFRSCKVKPCCVKNDIFTCAECKKHETIKDCKVYNPMLVRFGEFISQTSRGKCIEMIKKDGINSFFEFMINKNWLTFKRKEV